MSMSEVKKDTEMANSDGVFSYEEEDECTPVTANSQFDDDHNNNYILENSAEDEDDDDDDDYYEDDQDNNHHYHSHDDDDDYEDQDEAHRESLDPEFFDYESYPLEKLDWIVEKKCEQLISYLKLEDPLDALVLLRQFEWNHQTIIETYNKDKKQFIMDYLYTGDSNNNNSKKFDSLQDRIKLASYLNIFGDSSNTLLNTLSEKIKQIDSSECSKREEDAGLCNICFTNETDLASLAQCSHMFCVDCWSMHFEAHIQQGGHCSFECMQTKCNSVASRDFVFKCLQTSSRVEKKRHLVEKYKRLIAMDLIKESNDIQLCSGEERLPLSQQSFPNPANSTPTTRNAFKLVTTIAKNTGSPVTTITTISTHRQSAATTSSSTSTERKKCHYIVWIKSKPAARRVFCSNCEFQYCFQCALPYHAPNSCSIIRGWNVKCQDDSETRNYLLVHTQDCPKCKVCIEKNGGCSHMTCNRCKHEFCWVCGNDWKTHGATYDCNRYKGNPDKDTAREALNRYTHYYHRWINHANSLKFERALKEQSLLKIQEKIMNRAGGGTLVDWEFLIEAVDVLTRARYTLQYTYPYAYFLDSNEDKALFENIQAELEREVENLSHSLEKVNLNDKFNIKLQMDIVEKRRKTLLKDFIRS